MSFITHMLRKDVLHTCSTYANLWGVKTHIWGRKGQLWSLTFIIQVPVASHCPQHSRARPHCCCQQSQCGKGRVTGAFTARGLLQNCFPGAGGGRSLLALASFLSLTYRAVIEQLYKLPWHSQCCHLPSISSQTQSSPTLESSI